MYMRSVKAKRKSMEQENVSSVIYQRIEETSKCAKFRVGELSKGRALISRSIRFHRSDMR